MIIVVAGMPRSGSTLQSNIAKSLLEASKRGSRVDWAIDWQNNIDNIKEMSKSEEIYLLKSHWVTDEILNLSRDLNIRYLISYRDVRDVAVSMMIKFDYSFKKAKKRIAKAIDNIQRIRVLGENYYLEQPYPILKDKLDVAIKDVNDFLNLGVKESIRIDIENELSIDNLYNLCKKRKMPFSTLFRKVIFLLRLRFPFANEKYMLHANHISKHKGRQGVWQENLSKQQAEELQETFSDWTI